MRELKNHVVTIVTSGYAIVIYVII